MAVVLFVIGGLSTLILLHEAGHFFLAKKFGMKVDEFGFGFPPRLFARKIGETEYSLNLLPFGGFVKIAGENDGVMNETVVESAVPAGEKDRLFSFQPAGKRALVILAGVAVNFAAGWLLLSAVFMVGAPGGVAIEAVQPGSPAEQVGLQPGDVIVHYTRAGDFIQYINANRGEEIAVTVLRDGVERSFSVTPRATPAPGEGALGALLAETGIPREGFLVALKDGFLESAMRMWFTFAAFAELIAGLFRGTLLDGIVGPVGIVGVAQKATSIGFVYLVRLVGIISVSLAAANLLPFPALDGGRFLMILIEKLKGSRISFKTEAVANGVSFIFLILLMVLVTLRDIRALF